jgi:glycerol uptake facilitator-like aquaporin
MLLAGKALTVKASPVNPAIALGVFIFNGFDAKNLKTLLIFCTAPVGGSFLALLFFRYIYKTTTETMEMEDEDDHNEEGMLDSNDNLGQNLLNN